MIEIERTRKPIREISIIPMINVVFLLLIFFMVAGTLERFQILQVEMPVAESGETMQEGVLMIVLGRHDEILLNDALVTLEEVGPWVKKHLIAHPEQLITVKADARLAAPRMMDVLEAIQKAGGHNVSLATDAL